MRSRLRKGLNFESSAPRLTRRGASHQTGSNAPKTVLQRAWSSSPKRTSHPLKLGFRAGCASDRLLRPASFNPLVLEAEDGARSFSAPQLTITAREAGAAVFLAFDLLYLDGRV